MLATNEVLQQNRYRIIDQLGEDLTGAVYEAYDSVLETNVVLKEIKIDLEKVTTVSQQETRKSAFDSEAKILTEIKHDSLLHIHDYFSEIDNQYLVMESVSGQNLLELIEGNKNPVALSDLTGWADQLLDALHCLHTRIPPIIHGDIKPQNVKLTSDGKIKLLALSLAKNPDAKTNASTRNRTSLAAAAGLHYLPLEQIWDGLDPASKKVILNSYDEKSEKTLEQPIDVRSDIYGLGATLYHLATAQLPIDALERSIDILDGKPDPLPAPNRLNPNIPAEVSDVLMKALEIKRENRFGAAVIMRQILRTSLVRIKERGAGQENKQDTAAEIGLEKQMSSEREPQINEQKNLEQAQILSAQEEQKIEAEQKRQMESTGQPQREAEEQRLTAEKRADGENPLPEKLLEVSEAEVVIELDDSDILETDNPELLEISNDDEPPAAAVAALKSPEPIVQATPVENLAPSVDKPVAVEKISSDEFKESFDEPVKNNKSVKRLAAAAVGLLVFGGAGWGIWSSMSSKPVESNQIISTGEATAPKTAIEAAPAPNIQPAFDTNSASALSAEGEDVNNTGDSPELKNKSLSPASKAKKQALPSTKTPAVQKKAVTVEDIINDN